MKLAKSLPKMTNGRFYWLTRRGRLYREGGQPCAYGLNSAFGVQSVQWNRLGGAGRGELPAIIVWNGERLWFEDGFLIRSETPDSNNQAVK